MLMLRGSHTVSACIICENNHARRATGEGDFARHDCRRCGTFLLSGTAESVLQTELTKVLLRRSLMSHTVRRMQRADNSHLRIIDSEELPSFWSADRLPSPQQQADNLILWIGNAQATPLERAYAPRESLCALIGTAISDKQDRAGWDWLDEQLRDQNLYEAFYTADLQLGLRLTMPGWQRYAELKKTNAESRTAFMAMKFGDPTLQRVVAECFKPAVSRAGFQLRLLTDEQPAGLIDDQLRAAILSARFLIADLSHGNPGAYWEAGFAEGLALPVIYTCEATKWEESKTHFDTNHLVTIVWDETKLELAGNQLTATIRATLRGEAKQSDNE
jgi:hypothetical protein